jgi:subtilisin family serine protease
MSSKPFGLLLAALFASVPVFVFGQFSPRLGPEIDAQEILANSTLDLPDPAEAAEFDKTFSQPFPINDGIQRNYLLATDELYQPTTDGLGQIIKLLGATTPSTTTQVAKILSSEFRSDTRLVLHASGEPKNESTRRYLSRTLVVGTTQKEKLIQDAADAGLRVKSVPAYAPGHVVLVADDPKQMLSGVRHLQARGNAAGLQVSPKFLPAFLPNDPLFPNQWHIRGRGQNGAKKASDARITPVWEERDSSGNLIRGTGITIGIVDDGTQMDHPDLSNNISSTYRYSWVGADPSDPSPGAGDFHGTAVAGVAAAVGYNGLGATGTAPLAKIAPMRFLGTVDSDAVMESFAYGGSAIRVKNNSWVWLAVQPNAMSSAERSALASAANAGVVTLFCAGNAQNVVSTVPTNGRPTSDNVNLHETHNSIYSIPVAALNDQAIQCTYSTPGAPIVISAPSGLDAIRPQGTTTTDRTSSDGYNAGTGHNIYGDADYLDADYTQNFNGTSSACPVAAGVTALLLQANPSLNWRDVKEIYIRSATRNDSGDSDWARNGAGFWFNHKYGAGLINASEAVRLAKNWSNLGSMTSVSIPLSSIPATIRDNNAGGLVKYFDTRSLSGLRVEHATVTVDITHQDRGELEVQVTSPSGTTSRLAELHEPGRLSSSGGPLTPFVGSDRANYSNWTFSTVHNWGEDSRGLWKLKIADRVPGKTGTLNSATLTLYGTAK